MSNSTKPRLDPILYRSKAMPCPYVLGRTEQQVFTVLPVAEFAEWSERLNRLGFRRSMNNLYMPMCPGCQACISVRVKLVGFRLGRSFRRILRRNADIQFRIVEPQFQPEYFALFQCYLHSRHGQSDMNDIDVESFTHLLETIPQGAFLLCAYDAENVLVAVMMVDSFSEGYSAVYSFFDPALKGRSLGLLMILELIRRTGLDAKPYVYLGYYVADAPNMAYKARFAPLEFFDWDCMEWQEFQHECA